MNTPHNWKQEWRDAWPYGMLALIGLVLFAVGVRSSQRQVEALESIARATTYTRADLEAAQRSEGRRRHITKAEDEFVMKEPGCQYAAYIAYDNRLYPEWCRP